jgi:hypothetical protein
MKTITYEDLNEVNAILREGMDAEDERRWITAAQMIMRFLDIKRGIYQVEPARKAVEDFIFSFLHKGDYLSAATLLFGRDKFDARPQSSQDVFRVIREHPKVALAGASSMGKSFNAAFYLLMDYLADTRFTKIRIGAVNQEHLRANLFSDLVDAIESSVIDLQLDSIITNLEIRPKDAKAANHIIKGLLFPQGDERSTGRFKSLKPTRRPTPSEKWGPMGRVRILLDEAGNMSKGPYLDLDSPSASMQGPDRVKFILAFNPEDITHWTGQVCEPKNGWDSMDPEADLEWQSKEGWHVLRLDAARSENVVAKQEVYPGIQSYQGFLNFLSDGENSARYWTYGRGFWPMNSTSKAIIPMFILQNSKAEVTYPEGYKPCASVDVAASNNDKIIFTLGRWGKASGYEKRDGTRVRFAGEEGKSSLRHILQVEQQFEIPQTLKTEEIGKSIIERAKMFEVSPDWLVIDSTAIGKGVYDYLAANWGPVLGINWQRGATEHKFTIEDQESPKDLYANIGTEMWFGAKFWLEYGIMYFGNHITEEKLFKQLSTRQYRSHRAMTAKIMVESKDEYRKRGYSGSPDEADSLVMLAQLCRQRTSALPSQTGNEDVESGAAWADDLPPPPTIHKIDSLVFDRYKKKRDTKNAGEILTF